MSTNTWWACSRGILGAIIYEMHWILLPFKAATAIINAMCMSPCWKTRKSYFAATPAIGILKIYQGSYFVVIICAWISTHRCTYRQVLAPNLIQHWGLTGHRHQCLEHFPGNRGQIHHPEAHEGRTRAPIAPQRSARIHRLCL